MPEEIADNSVTEADISVEDIPHAPDSLKAKEESDSEKIERLSKRIGLLSNKNDEQKTKIADLAASLRTKDLLDSLIAPSARAAFRFMCVYASAVCVLLMLDGLGVCGFDLPESTLNYLVGSTAATVIGLVGMVLSGVFLGARK